MNRLNGRDAKWGRSKLIICYRKIETVRFCPLPPNAPIAEVDQQEPSKLCWCKTPYASSSLVGRTS